MRWGRGIGHRAAVAVGSSALLALCVPLARSGTPWDACPDKATHQSDHVVVAGPRFAQGPNAVTSIAADPRTMGALAVSNGFEVYLSDDAGCTWRRAFPFGVGGNGAAWLVARDGARVRAATVVRQVAVSGTAVHTLRLFAGDDGVETSYELPPDLATQECSESRRCLVRFAPRPDLAVGYATTPGLAGNLPRIAATTDGGRTWRTQAAPSVGGTPAAIGDLAVDPEDDAHVLAVAGGRVFESRDRGETWTGADVPDTLSPDARVAFTPGTKQPVLLADRVPGGTATFPSPDGGRTFVRSGVVVPAGPVRALAVGSSEQGPAVVVLAGGRLFRQNAGGAFDAVLPRTTGIAEVAATEGGLWLRRTGSLTWVDGHAALDDEPGPDEDRPSGRTGGTPGAGDLKGRAGGGALHVGERVVVPPGGTGDAVVTADLARQPRGIDVFFLMDTSGSMTTKMRPMADAMGRVVEVLNREGIAARFGLGEHGALSFRYRRHADLGTPPDEVQRRLAGLQTSSGEEFHYTSFQQIATGAGMQARTGGSIPPGQQASFQPGALRLVVHATDEVDNHDPEGPNEATALRALRDVGAHHVGIYPFDGSVVQFGGNDPVLDALRRYAGGTSTLAPSGGLDCDGDDDVDVPEGEPIACAVPGSSGANAPIARIIERVLLALSDRQPVAVEGGVSPLSVRVAALGDYRGLDLHERHTGLRFRVRVTCPPGQEGRDVEVPLYLVVGDVAVAAASLPVRCLAAASAPLPPPEPQPEEPEPPFRRPPARLLPALPPIATAPPALAQSTATASATASSTASQSVQATQVGIAVAPDEALQVATEEEDVRFVARRAAPPTAAGLAVVALLALLYAAEPRVATSLARTRDWRDRRW